MPQYPRTEAEDADFRDMLHNMDVMYLSSTVLLVVDMSYLTRFWTQFEAWLSFQSPATSGLGPASEASRRCTIKCILNADLDLEGVKLIRLWSKKTPTEARALLAGDATLHIPSTRATFQFSHRSSPSHPILTYPIRSHHIPFPSHPNPTPSRCSPNRPIPHLRLSHPRPRDVRNQHQGQGALPSAHHTTR